MRASWSTRFNRSPASGLPHAPADALERRRLCSPVSASPASSVMSTSAPSSRSRCSNGLSTPSENLAFSCMIVPFLSASVRNQFAGWRRADASAANPPAHHGASPGAEHQPVVLDKPEVLVLAHLSGCDIRPLRAHPAPPYHGSGCEAGLGANRRGRSGAQWRRMSRNVSLRPNAQGGTQRWHVAECCGLLQGFLERSPGGPVRTSDWHASLRNISARGCAGGAHFLSVGEHRGAPARAVHSPRP